MYVKAPTSNVPPQAPTKGKPATTGGRGGAAGGGEEGEGEAQPKKPRSTYRPQEVLMPNFCLPAKLKVPDKMKSNEAQQLYERAVTTVTIRKAKHPKEPQMRFLVNCATAQHAVSPAYPPSQFGALTLLLPPLNPL